MTIKWNCASAHLLALIPLCKILHTISTINITTQMKKITLYPTDARDIRTKLHNHIVIYVREDTRIK